MRKRGCGADPPPCIFEMDVPPPPFSQTQQDPLGFGSLNTLLNFEKSGISYGYVRSSRGNRGLGCVEMGSARIIGNGGMRVTPPAVWVEENHIPALIRDKTRKRKFPLILFSRHAFSSSYVFGTG